MVCSPGMEHKLLMRLGLLVVVVKSGISVSNQIS